MSDRLAGGKAELTFSQARLLADTIRVTQEMLVSGQLNDWNAVADKELTRRGLLEQCFDSPVSEQNSDSVAEALAVILHLNEELLGLLLQARQASLVETNNHSKSRKAVDEYSEVGTCR
ncbi:MAG: flagellar protein FliT [Luminiphilus sp.]|nr:flagellar protein FliT [Luminiphilus sp.]